jgi:NmrA-like family
LQRVEYLFQKLLLCRAKECSKSNQEIQMILVTGATGNNGLEVLKRLASQNVQARAIVRDASGTQERARNRAKAIADLGIEMVEADFDRPETLPSALAGVDRAFLVTNSTEHVESAKQSGVKHRVPKKDWFYSCFTDCWLHRHQLRE